MNISAIFSLTGVLLQAGKTTEALGAIYQLEPLAPLLTGPITPAKIVDFIAAEPAAAEAAQGKAAGDLIAIIAGLLADPKTKAATAAALKGLAS